MKKRFAAFVLSLAMVFTATPAFGAVQALDMQQEETADFSVRQMGADASANRVTIAFQANGGTGNMGNLTVSANAPTTLTKNKFTRPGFTFIGWNTSADGSGTAYADGQSITWPAETAGSETTAVLYAQWKINAPKLKKVSTTVPGALKVTYSKIAPADSYQIQYSVKRSFQKAKTVVAKKGTSGTQLLDLVPNKKYFVRVRSYDSTSKRYSDWSNVKSKKTKKGSTLANTKCATGIEADITLSGTGTGYHAKLVLVTPLSAVSYGIQFDQCAVAPYTGKAMAMIENVASNAAGGQQYSRPGNKALKTGKKYHMMITINTNGTGNVYLDYKKIGSFSNPQLANQAVYPRVEAAVRLNGDSVKATFDNIRLKRGGMLQEGIFPEGQIFKSNKGIQTKRTKNKNKITISGKGTGINGDWDSDYEGVSGIYQF